MQRPRWQQEGQEPDYRFSLANERTYLAWVRTGLAVLAGGVALDQFAAQLTPRAWLQALVLALATTAAALFCTAYLRWRANEQAMRHARPLPSTAGIPFLAASMLVATAVIALLVWKP